MSIRPRQKEPRRPAGLRESFLPKVAGEVAVFVGGLARVMRVFSTGKMSVFFPSLPSATVWTLRSDAKE